MNKEATFYEQRSDIGVFDAYFTVNGERYGPGVQVVSFQGNSFTAVAELYAFENMPGPIQITAKVKLDHNSGIPANDYTVKTTSVQMQQDPQDYNTTPRTRIEISFSGDDMQSVNLQDYRGAYIELLEGGNAFYSTDWKQYAGLSQVQGNRRYEEYDTYRRSPYSYPQNYLYFTFTNMNDDYQNIGGTVNINGQDIDSGEPVPFFFDENVTAIAEEIINYSSADYKHHNWQKNYADFFRTKSFVANSSQVWDYDIHFKVPDNVNITCQGGDVLQLEIHDPWYVDANGNQPNDFRLISEVAPAGIHRVFRDQLINPNNPYYSVRAEDQTIGGREAYFLKWSGSGVTFQNSSARQTAVVFNSPNATVTANMKGHLVSNSATATAHNNGRRIVRDAANTLHAVYEDGGSIWYTHSTDNGEHWAGETRIAAPEHHRCLYPAIAEYEGALHVVYSDVFYEDENPTAAEIYYLSKSAGGAWQVVDGFPGSGIPHPSQIPKPAVAVWRSGSERYAVISYNRFNVYSRVTTYYKRPGQISQFAGEFAGTNPSLGADELHIDIRLSYEHE